MQVVKAGRVDEGCRPALSGLAPGLSPTVWLSNTMNLDCIAALYVE